MTRQQNESKNSLGSWDQQFITSEERTKRLQDKIKSLKIQARQARRELCLNSYPLGIPPAFRFMASEKESDVERRVRAAHTKEISKVDALFSRLRAELDQQQAAVKAHLEELLTHKLQTAESLSQRFFERAERLRRVLDQADDAEEAASLPALEQVYQQLQTDLKECSSAPIPQPTHISIMHELFPSDQLGESLCLLPENYSLPALPYVVFDAQCHQPLPHMFFAGPESDPMMRFAKLHRACVEGDLETVKRIWQGGVDSDAGRPIDLHDARRLSGGSPFPHPLEAAAWNGHVSVVKWLVEEAKLCGDDDDCKRLDNNCLAYACVSQNVELVSYLLEHFSPSNSSFVPSPLRVASALYDVPIAELLVSRYPSDEKSVQQLTSDVKTALDAACSTGEVESTRFLLDVAKEQKMEVTADWLLSVRKHRCTGSLALVRFLVEYARAECGPLSPESFIELIREREKHAAGTGEVEQVEYLADTFQLPVGIDELLHAAFNGQLPVVRLLLRKYGVDVNQVKDGLDSALADACDGGDLEMLKFLLERAGANPASCEEWPVLLAAVYADFPLRLVKYLVESGRVNIDQRNPLGNSALHCACSADEIHPELVPYLVNETLINVNALNHKGRSALYFAITRNHLPVIQLLVAKGARLTDVAANGFTPVLHACRFADLPVIRYFFEELDVDVGPIARRVLEVACANGKLEVVKYLCPIIRGSLTRVAHGRGEFGAACGSGSLPLIQALVERLALAPAERKQHLVRGARRGYQFPEVVSYFQTTLNVNLLDPEVDCEEQFVVQSDDAKFAALAEAWGVSVDALRRWRAPVD